MTQYFETIKCLDSSVYHLQYHKDRIANTIGLNFNLEEYIYPPSDALLRCKVIYNNEAIEDIQYFPYKRKDFYSFKLIYDDLLEYDKKYLNRSMIDKHLCDDIDEVIFVKNNLISDTSIANIAILLDNIWYTPKSPLLHGTTRERYLDNKVLIEKDISVDLLQKASKIALLNCMLDFHEIDDYKIINKD